MPIRAFRKFRKHHKRVAGRKAGGRKARLNAPPRSMPAIAEAGRGQSASIVETIQFPDVSSNTSYAYIFDLAQFDRARTLAPQFQYYKPAKVTWTYECLYNTFQEGSNYAKPYMFSSMDRTQQLTASSLGALQHAGARSVAFTKTQTISYVPNWVSPGAVALAKDGQGNVSSVYAQGYKKEYGWVNCPTRTLGSGAGPDEVYDVLYNASVGQPLGIATANNMCYFNGHRMWIDQTPATTANVIARVTCTVHWLFKGAKYQVSGASPTVDVPVAAK